LRIQRNDLFCQSSVSRGVQTEIHINT